MWSNRPEVRRTAVLVSLLAWPSKYYEAQVGVWQNDVRILESFAEYKNSKDMAKWCELVEIGGAVVFVTSKKLEKEKELEHKKDESKRKII